jgi:hypothetical protein
MDDYQEYQRKRALQFMKTAKSYMNKVGNEIEGMIRHKAVTEDIEEWQDHAEQINGAAEILQSWINELERIVYEKQNGGTGTENAGKCCNSVTETDGFREIGIPNTKSNSQVQKED